MRKNLFNATLIGLCIIGITACSKGEENKATDTPESQTTAMAAPQQPAAEPSPVAAVQAPQQTASSEPVNVQSAPTIAANNSTSSAATPDAQTSAPAAAAPAAVAPAPAASAPAGDSQPAMPMTAPTDTDDSSSSTSTDNSNSMTTAPAAGTDATQPK